MLIRNLLMLPGHRGEILHSSPALTKAVSHRAATYRRNWAHPGDRSQQQSLSTKFDISLQPPLWLHGNALCRGELGRHGYSTGEAMRTLARPLQNANQTTYPQVKPVKNIRCWTNAKDHWTGPQMTHARQLAKNVQTLAD
jgi:hypothetical protein